MNTGSHATWLAGVLAQRAVPGRCTLALWHPLDEPGSMQLVKLTEPVCHNKGAQQMMPRYTWSYRATTAR